MLSSDGSKLSIEVNKMTEAAQLTVLCLAAALGGAVNSVAGGGTLLTFPALLWVLGPSAAASVIANATSTIALFPGSIAAAWGYRRELSGSKKWIATLAFPSLVGAAIGTWLVAKRDPQEFQILVPWLIAIATMLFLMQPTITRWTGIGKPHAVPSRTTRFAIIAFQFLIAIYGGYFGAGIGILMLTALALMGIADIHYMNGIKTVLASTINGVSVVMFIQLGKAHWGFAIPMALASIAGGIAGVSLARRVNKNAVRYGVIAIGLVLSLYYFVRTYSVILLCFEPTRILDGL